MLEEIKNIKSSKKELKDFSYVIGSVLLLISAYLWWKNNTAFWLWNISGIGVLIVGFIVPVLLTPFQYIWMAFSVITGWFMTRIILCILFYLVLTPISIIMKLTGKHFLNIKIEKDASSYWIPKKKQKTGIEFYEKQF